MNTPDRLELAVLQNLSSRFGGIRSDNGIIVRVDGGDLPEEEIAKAREEVRLQSEIVAVGNECDRRIYAVMKNIVTQVNIALWLAAGADGDESAKATAKKLVKWMSSMRSTAHKLRRNPNFREDKHWPPVPSGVKEFVDRF